MRHLRVVIHIKFVAVFLRQPFTRETEPRVDPNALIRNSNAIVLGDRLIRDIKAFFSKRMDTSRARGAELSSEFLINLEPIINRRARWHSWIAANAGKRLTFGSALQKFGNHVILELDGHNYLQKQKGRPNEQPSQVAIRHDEYLDDRIFRNSQQASRMACARMSSALRMSANDRIAFLPP